MSKIDIIELDVTTAPAAINELASVLADCVNGGASVNFMLPYSAADAAEFFRKIVPSIASGETILLAARIDGRIVGTVQLGLDTPPNQPHRAEVKKMLVHRAARGKGVGAALLSEVEARAKQKGRTLLVLDTASDDARRLYERGGWQRLGNIPDYALLPDGALCDTTIYWTRQ
ncbi:MAG TPA: GNAT family N-acetyltransferase [Nevskiaceae bacterium]|nr:GNAT family N-acetyltransferase [Nevskiaceae bacterium]